MKIINTLSFTSLIYFALLTAVCDAAEIGNAGDIKVSLLRSAFVGRTYISTGKSEDHFIVLLENTSARELKLWGGLANGGYQWMYFSLVDTAGNKFTVKRSTMVEPVPTRECPSITARDD